MTKDFIDLLLLFCHIVTHFVSYLKVKLNHNVAQDTVKKGKTRVGRHPNPCDQEERTTVDKALSPKVVLSLVENQKISPDPSDCVFGLFTFMHMLIYKYVHYIFALKMELLETSFQVDTGNATLSQKSQTQNEDEQWSSILSSDTGQILLCHPLPGSNHSLPPSTFSTLTEQNPEELVASVC